MMKTCHWCGKLIKPVYSVSGCTGCWSCPECNRLCGCDAVKTKEDFDPDVDDISKINNAPVGTGIRHRNYKPPSRDNI